MSQQLFITPCGLRRFYTDIDGNKVIPALGPGIGFQIPATANVWIVAKGTPAAVSTSFDPVNNTSSSGITLSANMNAGELGGAFFCRLTARVKAEATTALLANTVSLIIAGVIVARVSVDATTQTAGVHIAYNPVKDTRFIMGDAGVAVTGGTIEADDNIYTKAAHGFVTGQRVVLTSLTGGTGLSAAATYFFHALSLNTGYLCSTYALAIAGTAVDVTVDASSVVLTPKADAGIELTTVDPALEVEVEIVGSD